jgi:hemerythrin
MSLLRWKDEYRTDVQEIDTQHQRLIDQVNDIHDLMRQGRGQQALAEAIGELTEYTRYHFSCEEKLMAEGGYDRTEAHTLEHGRLLGQIFELRRYVQDGHLVVTMNEMQFLRDWLVTHFMGPDRELAGHLKERRTGA